MKKYAILSVVCNVFAIALFIGGIIAFSSAKNTSIGSVCVSFGFVLKTLGTFFSRKERKNKENDATETTETTEEK